MEGEASEEVEKVVVKIEIYNKSDKLIVEKEVNIEKSKSGFYSVISDEEIIMLDRISLINSWNSTE